LLVRLLLVGAGGFLGAALRYGVALLALRLLPSTFPYGTLVVNVTGCFTIGLLAAWFDLRAAGLAPRLFWTTGVLGGYTTFSAFGYETLALLRQGDLGAALVNVGAQVAVGLLAVWAGLTIARAWA
jgi:fluoride exporter